MNLGERIKKYREECKMTQKDIAKILGVKPGTISKYESCMIEPNIEAIKKLAEIFKITIDELLKNDNENFDISKINVLEVLREQKEMKLKGNLYHNTQIVFAYNTNHIEGSKLTEDQTRFIYETNFLITKKDNEIINIDDITETLNHFKLVDYMLDIANEQLTEEMIKVFHKILKTATSDSMKEWFNVGDYKKIANEIGNIRTSAPKDVSKNMKDLIAWYNQKENVSINDIIEFHVRFERIHPFQDGNGRVGRIIMFKECLKNNIIPFIILDKYKAFYYRGLYEYDKEKGYLIDICLNAQDNYIKMIEYYIKMELIVVG